MNIDFAMFLYFVKRSYGENMTFDLIFDILQLPQQLGISLENVYAGKIERCENIIRIHVSQQVLGGEGVDHRKCSARFYRL